MPAGICGVAKPPRVCIARRGYLLEAARARRRRSPHSCRCSQRTPMALPNPDPDYRINTGICLYRNGLVWVGRCATGRGLPISWFVYPLLRA